MQITVAICTWNRANLLDQTLTQMRQLRIPKGVQWELLVVNNNCTDETDRVLERHTGHLPLQRLFEPSPGLSNARNRASQAARGELILWTDDDVLVDQDWLAAYVAAAEAFPEASYFGGPINPWFPVTPPRWILRHWERLKGDWAVLQQRDGVSQLVDGELLFGANMGFRREAVARYKFDPQLGRKGASLMSGEETAYVGQLKRDGHWGVWVGPAQVDHYIPADRLTAAYVWELHRCRAREVSAGFQDHSPRLWGQPRWLLRRYWSACASAKLLSLVKGERWLEAFLDAARWKGMLDLCVNLPAPERKVQHV